MENKKIDQKENYKNNSDKSSDNQNSQEEIGGFKKHNPTEHGDWQHNGRVTDF